jgi:hypothetical protein
MQCKYSVTEIKLLAIVETLKEFKGMLWVLDLQLGMYLLAGRDH